MNYLLSIAGKIFAFVLMNKHKPDITEEVIVESQVEFRANRVTVGMMFVQRQVLEQCKEINMELCPAFNDQQKALESANRKES